jgi:hypothetical protein
MLFLSLAMATEAWSEEFYVPDAPKDYDQVDFYLITVGRGKTIESRFGHSIVRVVDRLAHTDFSFNWGIFDFNAPNFVLNFYIGNLNYALGISRTGDLLNYYRVYEKRRYVEQFMNLTKHQKKIFMERFLENARPENIHYQYIHLFDNCATRIRDHLDAALGGALRKKYATAPGAAHFRYYIRTATDGIWWAYFGLDFLSNSGLDRPISQWEEMFLPSMLQMQIDKMPALDDQGVPLADLNLLGPQRTIIDRPEPLPGGNPYFYFGLGFSLLSALGVLGRFYKPQSAATWRFWGFCVLVFGLWSMIWGSVMSINWVVSNHKELQHNANLWLFWPVDGLFVLAGFLLVKRGNMNFHLPLRKWLNILATLHLISLPIFIIASLVGLISQDVLPTLASFAPAALLIYGTIRNQEKRYAVLAEQEVGCHAA